MKLSLSSVFPVFALAFAPLAMADVPDMPEPLRGPSIVYLGEVHDNPDHHAAQAAYVAQLGAKAVVFEMLTKEQAAMITPQLRADKAALAEALDWAASGWPSFDMYYPILAANEARIYGAAVPRAAAKEAYAKGVAQAFGPDAEAYGLTTPLPKDQKNTRLEMQFAAHCEMMPKEALGPMIDIQRLRDASLARAAIEAMRDTGGPVAVILGNGHARVDWGAPAYVGHVAPDVTQISLGQIEDAHQDPSDAAQFDVVIVTDTVEREDPCKAFEKK